MSDRTRENFSPSMGGRAVLGGRSGGLGSTGVMEGSWGPSGPGGGGGLQSKPM